MACSPVAFLLQDVHGLAQGGCTYRGALSGSISWILHDVHQLNTQNFYAQSFP